MKSCIRELGFETSSKAEKSAQNERVLFQLCLPPERKKEKGKKSPDFPAFPIPAVFSIPMELGGVFGKAHTHCLWAAIKLQAHEFSAAVRHRVKLRLNNFIS